MASRRHDMFMFMLLLHTVFLTNSINVPPICSQPSSQTEFLDFAVSNRWTGFEGNTNIYHTPVVMDVNGDTFSDIIFVIANVHPNNGSAPHPYVIALSGNPDDNLTTLWSYTNTTTPPFSAGSVAVAKTQHGNMVCFPSINTTSSTFLTCINFSGKHLFTTQIYNPNLYWTIQVVIISIDTIPYIIAENNLLNSSGHIMWNKLNIAVRWRYTVSDLNNDGIPEIIYYDRVVNALNGSFSSFFDDSLYSVGNADQGFVGVADFDGDGNGDILKAGLGYVSLWMHNGTLIDNYTLPDAIYKGSPLIRDLDNDGNLEFGFVATGTQFEVYTFNKLTLKIEKLWNATIIDTSSGITGAISVDLNGDGQYEVLYADITTFYIFSSNGSTLYKSTGVYHASSTFLEYPLYVDLDNDGSGEIITINNWVTQPPLVILSAKQKESWTPTTSVWTDLDFNFREGVEQGFVNSPFSPNWKLPFKDKNFARGAINSCWVCTGVLDPIFVSFNPECIAQKWVISAQTVTIQHSSVSLNFDVHLKIENDFVLDENSTLTFVVSEKGETGSLEVGGTIIQDGNINVDLTSVKLKLNESIELKNLISFGDGSTIKMDKVEVITSPSLDPCYFVDISQIPEQNSLSLSMLLSTQTSQKCDVSDTGSSVDNTLLIGLVVGLVGGCILFVIIAGIVILVVFAYKHKILHRKLRASSAGL